MKAALFTGDTASLTIEEVELDADTLGEHDVRIEVGATGVCHSDLSALHGTFGPMHNPSILGHEGAGRVVAVGSGVSRTRVGDRVITTFIPACGECFFCVRDQSNLCELNAVLRGRGIGRAIREDGSAARAFCNLGTFAEEMIVHEANVVTVQTDLPDEQLALVGCGVTTGACAVFNTAQVRPGSTVAVIGCGGVGQAVIQAARISGAARIFAVDPVPFKRESARSFGATDLIDPAAADPVEQLRQATDGRGVDYVFEVVGRPETVVQAHTAARFGGAVVLIGAGLPGQQVAFDLFALHREKKLLGCGYGSAQVRRDIPRLVALAESGQLDLGSMVSRTMTLGQVNEAFTAMSSGDVVRSVLVGA
ncbi:Zn-dependent alcohol dehydrogenase [Nocardioides acrostichi]|uniref:Zn-dependent alcohol dehydrogenase n=1 Tax=Nocardioides acrostichi TaxID=2784339 RepID=A0A930V504_9ACTN|nr:Zn-dependent alcohol dehydrogenase [Nocardioides acrostichi]MBF4163294.1 Zn-dependent alcohol dehydrogenase [Nocardioides acrostichi]